MRLYQVNLKVFRQRGEMELLIPALSPDLAENKIRAIIGKGRLFVACSYTRPNPHTGQDEEVQVRERIAGLVTACEVTEVCRNAFHRRRWDEERQCWTYPAPRYNGRRLVQTAQNYAHATTTREQVNAFRQGADDAKNAFAPRKKADTQTKNARKNYKGPHPDHYAEGFAAAWTRLARTTKTTPKKIAQTA